MNLREITRLLFMRNTARKKAKEYFDRFGKYSFVDCKCQTSEQFQASITRLYHTIEKGLAHENYRGGFGKDNIEKLIESLDQYSKMGYDRSAFFYETALSCLNAYIEKNKAYGYIDSNLEKRVRSLPGEANNFGGTIMVSKPINPEIMNYEQLVTTRHSIRHFSDQPVDIKLLVEAVKLAQYTPSACNRQGWKTRIVSDREKIETILINQNGNKGFGKEIDKILVVTADLRAQQRNRELFQAYIDGGMYAESVLNALYYKGLGSVPLSAALLPNQDKTIREALSIDDAEVFIIFIGVGNYPDGTVLTTHSERNHSISIQVL